MTNQEAIYILDQIRKVLLRDESWLESTTQPINESFGMAVSALQAQDSETRRICDTCKHNPPSKKWPCVDCDVREPADRWEEKDVPDTNVGDMISRQAAINAALENVSDKRTHEFNAGAIRAVNRIKSLPSAQPEIIRCMDCKNYGSYWGRCRHWEKISTVSIPVAQNDFCSWAERRTNV